MVLSTPVIFMVKKFEETIVNYGMLNRGNGVVVACSGGIDSMTLLHLFSLFAKNWDLRLAVAHLNHGLRGEEADKDETFVRQRTEALGVPFFSKRIDLKSLAAEKGQNLQEAGREVRYRFFEEVSDKTGGNRIAFGHNADDQAETVIMRIVRGAGLKGLGGIPPVRGNIIRPLIEITREEIGVYGLAEKIEFREDPSNADKKYLRNRVRHDVIPLLKALNPNACVELCNLSGFARDANAYLEEEAARAFARISLSTGGDDGTVCLNLAKINGLPSILKRKVIFSAIEELTGSRSGFYSSHIVSVEALLEKGQSGSALHLPKGVRVVVEYGKALFSTMRDETPPPYRYELNFPGETVIPEAGMTLLAVKRGAIDEKEEIGDDRLLLDLSRIEQPLLVRNFREGDRIRLPGMSGRKKLKSLFIDEKVPRAKRRRIPLVVSGDEILWVVGVRKSKLFLASSGSKEVVSIAKI